VARLKERPEVPLTGYADPLSGRPGDRIGFHISSLSGKPYRADLVRIECADPNPAGPGLRESPVALDLGGPFPGRRQRFSPGSCALVEGDSLLHQSSSFYLAATVSPFLLPEVGRQTIMALSGNSPAGFLVLEFSGNDCLRLMCGDRELLRLDLTLQKKQWYRVAGWLDFQSGHCGLSAVTLRTGREQKTKSKISADGPPACSRIVIAADWAGQSVRHFNGKIEAPEIRSGPDPDAEVIAAWDFSRNISSNLILDTGPLGLNGRLLNFPARGMTGVHWDGSEMNWAHKPEHYGAIHFHEDDIVDFGWQADFELTIPYHLPSGAYAVRIDDGSHVDWLPFYVVPARGMARNRLCVLVSTLTYAVYGNHARPDFTPEWVDATRSKGGYPWNPAEFPQYGLSTYNVHRDGSGICHASHKRPLFNMRPGYITFPTQDCSGLRHYQADSHLLYWLEQQGIGYDIVTDRQLHEEGVSVLDGYEAVCTGTHPEYHTGQTLDALHQWRDQGGHLIYLGGNGFYWRVAVHAEDNGVIEIRRAEGGIRAWAAEPGEYYHAFDGSYGGLWRRNRRPPQELAGVGFSAQGTFKGSWYRRTPLSYDDPEVAFLFEGIEEEILGDFGLCGGGAAGFELDRFDPDLGSDPGIKVVASSGGHGDEFTLVPEERLTHITNWPGLPESDLIRADMIYQQLENGGKLFSTGSITFCGSLLVNGGDNNISRLLANVMREFLSPVET
jgi:N,N-dimethylformamidase